MKELVYGQDTTEGIVALEVENNQVRLFFNDGKSETRDYKNWFLTNRPLPRSKRLEGDLDFRFLNEYETKNHYWDLNNICTQNGIEKYTVWNLQEQAMIKSGITLFKGLQVKDVSVLAFDIEATGLKKDDSAKVVLISNTYRRGSVTKKKLFCIEDYVNQQHMINAWCEWVCKENPSILCGHNVLGYDLPYLEHCYGSKLPLGRDGRFAFVEDYTRKFRKDGSQSYDFNDYKCYGRQIIDTMFLAIKYDFSRKYVSYGLKQIIAQEGLEKENRVHWNWEENPVSKVLENKELMEKFKLYCKDDGDDALALYDLMIPSFFYYTQSIPMTLQQINNTATGKQLNSLLVRSYLQQGHSIPKSCRASRFEGAISFGNPGIYSHVLKVDVASLYPSIMRQWKIYDSEKDPLEHFYKLVDYFTLERLKNKKLGKETGQRYYKDIEQAQKIAINSFYGLLGASGLNFNSPKNASLVTEHGRNILKRGMDWVKKRGYQLVNVDTDSFSYTKGREVGEVEFNEDIEDINRLYPELIVWEDDGMFDKVIVLKSKNYVLKSGDSLTIKGSALKDQKKEKALSDFLKGCIKLMLNSDDVNNQLRICYDLTVRSIFDYCNIEKWTTKKTVTDAVLNSPRTNEKKIRDAIGSKHVQEGDKIWVYPCIKGVKTEYPKSGKEKLVEVKGLKLQENFNPQRDDRDKMHLVKRDYNTVKILSEVFELKNFPNCMLKQNQNLLK